MESEQKLNSVQSILAKSAERNAPPLNAPRLAYLVDRVWLQSVLGNANRSDAPPRRADSAEQTRLRGTRFDFLSYSVDSLWLFDDIIVIEKSENDFLERNFAEYKEIRRFQNIDRTFELHFPKIKIVFSLFDKTIEFSRFLSEKDFRDYIRIICNINESSAFQLNIVKSENAANFNCDELRKMENFYRISDSENLIYYNENFANDCVLVCCDCVLETENSLCNTNQNDCLTNYKKRIQIVEKARNSIVPTLEGLPENDGLVGIANIGNSCYMAVALQIIAHDSVLKFYLTSPTALANVNKHNPLGTRGDVLQSLRRFLIDYWTTKSGTVAPTALKAEIVRHAPTFAGRTQQDAQEFLSHLLDAIHEDTNRILTKPIVDRVEGRRGDEDWRLARRCWLAFLRRNYSIVTQNFFGQYRSVVECAECGFSSLTFEPFQILSLPSLAHARRAFNLYWIDADQRSAVVRYRVVVESPPKATVGDVITRFSASLDRPISALRMAVCGTNCQIAVLSFETTIEDAISLSASEEKPSELFLCELNDTDLRCFTAIDRLLVIFHSQIDEPPNGRLFAKFFYLTARHSVEEMHIAILRKLFRATNLAAIFGLAAANVDEVSLRRVWSALRQNGAPLFFTVSVGARTLTESDFSLLLGDFTANGQTIEVSVLLKAVGGIVKTALEELSVYTTVDAPIVVRGERPQKADLLALFSELLRPEELCGDNLWFCSACKKRVTARKQLKLFKTPETLIVHLKRAENAAPIDFPIDELDLSALVMDSSSPQDYNIFSTELFDAVDLSAYAARGYDPIFGGSGRAGLKYKLAAVVHHQGVRDYGHYYVHIAVGDRWYAFNDDAVTAAERGELVEGNPYLLVYRKI